MKAQMPPIHKTKITARTMPGIIIPPLALAGSAWGLGAAFGVVKLAPHWTHLAASGSLGVPQAGQTTFSAGLSRCAPKIFPASRLVAWVKSAPHWVQWVAFAWFREPQ